MIPDITNFNKAQTNMVKYLICCAMKKHAVLIPDKCYGGYSFEVQGFVWHDLHKCLFHNYYYTCIRVY